MQCWYVLSQFSNLHWILIACFSIIMSKSESKFNLTLRIRISNSFCESYMQRFVPKHVDEYHKYDIKEYHSYIASYSLEYIIWEK